MQREPPICSFFVTNPTIVPYVDCMYSYAMYRLQSAVTLDLFMATDHTT